MGTPGHIWCRTDLLWYKPDLLAFKTSNHARYFVKMPLKFHYFLQMFNIFKLHHNHGIKWHAVFLLVFFLMLFYGMRYFGRTKFNTLKHSNKIILAAQCYYCKLESILLMDPPFYIIPVGVCSQCNWRYKGSFWSQHFLPFIYNQYENHLLKCLMKHFCKH